MHECSIVTLLDESSWMLYFQTIGEQMSILARVHKAASARPTLLCWFHEMQKGGSSLMDCETLYHVWLMYPLKPLHGSG